MEAKEAN